MHLRTFSLIVLFTLGMLPVFSQQKVDMDKVLAENPNLYTGGFSRIGIGFSSSNFSYGPIFDGLSLAPLRFQLDFGKRMNRAYGIYFTMTGDVLLNEVSSGYDILYNWVQVGMHVGGLFYIKGGRSYIAPEAGVGIITFEYDDYFTGYIEQPYSIGLGTSLKYGYDRHISGKVSLGGQLYITYTYAWETDVPEGYEAYIAKSFIFGASFNIKFGK